MDNLEWRANVGREGMAECSRGILAEHKPTRWQRLRDRIVWALRGLRLMQ